MYLPPSIRFLTTPPPIHPDDDLIPPPGSILLDMEGFISDRTNATTAEGFTRDRKPIRVTIWAVHPPRVSCFTVYSPELEISAFGAAPKILTTLDDLVLLRVPICGPRNYVYPSQNHFFVYHAGTESKRPSLDLIPTPPTCFFSDQQAALLRRRDMYFVAILRWERQYNLHLYNSETGTWSTKLMHRYSRHKSPQVPQIRCSKVITIGGELGSIGWVDLLKGILICDVLLEDNHKLRYIRLPPPAVHALGRPLSLVRDIIFFEGYIKYFEMCLCMGADKGWDAVAWRRKASWKSWKKDCVINVRDDPGHTGPLPCVQETDETNKEQPTLTGSYSGYPSLSLHDAGVVYIMDRHDSFPTMKATIIAFEMKNQTLKGAADYSSGRPLGFTLPLSGSGISKHLRWASSTRVSVEPSTTEIVQAGKQEVQEFPREGLQSQLSKVHGTSRKCRGRRGRCRIEKLK